MQAVNGRAVGGAQGIIRLTRGWAAESDPRKDGMAVPQALERAVLAPGRLDNLDALLPDTSIFLYSYVRKKAVLSSMIEGTQSSLADLLLFELEEAPGVPVDDVLELGRRRVAGRATRGAGLASCVLASRIPRAG